MPPVLQGDFLTFLGLALLSVVCQASHCGVMVPRAGMQFEGRRPHRFSELGARAPGLVYLVLNIEVLAAYSVSRSPCQGRGPERSPLAVG